MLRNTRTVLLFVLTLLALGLSDLALAELGQAPPRISLVSGSGHFWRPGDTTWSEVQLNFPLAPGDALHTGNGGVIEVQLGPRSFLRLPQDSYVQWVDTTADSLRFSVNTGNVSLDLRSLADGERIILDAPNVSYTLDGPGAYRLDVSDRESLLNVRHGGRAMATLADGRAYAISNGEQAVVQANGSIDAQALPKADAWDQWNEERTRAVLNPVTPAARQLAGDMSGAYELDRYGTWQTMDNVGSVWRPSNVPLGWTPYSNGKWVYDPVYGWSWLDQSPWGWAPYHYGQWLKINNIWFWAPGSRAVAQRYVPASASPHLVLPPAPREPEHHRFVLPYRPAMAAPVAGQRLAPPRLISPPPAAPAPSAIKHWNAPQPVYGTSHVAPSPAYSNAPRNDAGAWDRDRWNQGNRGNREDRWDRGERGERPTPAPSNAPSTPQGPRPAWSNTNSPAPFVAPAPSARPVTPNPGPNTAPTHRPDDQPHTWGGATPGNAGKNLNHWPERPSSTPTPGAVTPPARPTAAPVAAPVNANPVAPQRPPITPAPNNAPTRIATPPAPTPAAPNPDTTPKRWPERPSSMPAPAPGAVNPPARPTAPPTTAPVSANPVTPPRAPVAPAPFTAPAAPRPNPISAPAPAAPTPAAPPNRGSFTPPASAPPAPTGAAPRLQPSPVSAPAPAPAPATQPRSAPQYDRRPPRDEGEHRHPDRDRP